MIIKQRGILNRVLEKIRKIGDEYFVFDIDTDRKMFVGKMTAMFDEIESVNFQYYKINKRHAIKTNPDIDYGNPSAIIYFSKVGAFRYNGKDMLIVFELFKVLCKHEYKIRKIISGNA
jgi:hypothetical protein